MNYQERAGIVERVQDNIIPETDKTYCLIHQSLSRKHDSNKKLRLVFDTPSKLNEKFIDNC